MQVKRRASLSHTLPVFRCQATWRSNGHVMLVKQTLCSTKHLSPPVSVSSQPQTRDMSSLDTIGPTPRANHRHGVLSESETLGWYLSHQAHQGYETPQINLASSRGTNKTHSVTKLGLFCLSPCVAARRRNSLARMYSNALTRAVEQCAAEVRMHRALAEQECCSKQRNMMPI